MLMLMIILFLIAPFLVVLFPVLVPLVVVPALAHVVLVLVRVSPGKTNSDISI